MATPDTDYYSLAEVLAIANIHPFYNPNSEYPPSAQTIQSTRANAAKANHDTATLLEHQPLLHKAQLYTTIQRLINDTSPLNTYRQSIYVSVTGGGSGRSQPLFFGTDVHENRHQRQLFGRFLALTGVITPGVDWVVTVHAGGSGSLYRALDLTLEIMENAGASLLALGDSVPPEKVVQTLVDYHANVLAGDGSQVVALAHYISKLSGEERDRLRGVVNKVIYTSERLTSAQKEYIRSVLGDHVSILSVMGSAEGGPYAVNNPALTAGMESDVVVSTGGNGDYVDFVYDTRSVLFEIFPVEVASPAQEQSHPPGPLPDGEVGIIVQTSLARLRNPLVRYVTGDLGSLHALPEQARGLVPEADWPFLGVLRHRGRDGRFTFEWGGEYLEFDNLAALMNDGELGVLQWQVILDKMDGRPAEATLEVRVLLAAGEDTFSRDHREKLLRDNVRSFFHVIANNQDLFRLRLVDSLDGFERSGTGGKVIKFLDRFTGN